MHRRTRLAAWIILAGALAWRPGEARGAPRPRFEPTDLEWEDTGVAEFDMQVGPVRSSDGPLRIVVPDFELDLGVLPWLELDLDGAYAVSGPDTGPFSLDHSAPDALWPSIKFGLAGIHDDGASWGAAFGLQIGPKLPVAPGAHGIGVEALVVMGGAVRRLTCVLNMGGFYDPAPDAMSHRPGGLELGVDLQYKLDDIDRFSLKGEISGTTFVTSDPNQAQVTLGFAWNVLPMLELSLTGLLGTPSGGDRYGLLFGISPKFRFFK